MEKSVRIFPDLESLSRAAAEIVAVLAEQAVAARGRFSLALSGGKTPLGLYKILAAPPFRERIRWQSVHIFWGDERCVPAADPRNNSRAARRALLDSVPVPLHQIHPIQTELPPAKAAAQYEIVLRNFFNGGPPVFDLILLGLGSDGHTASLFPHTSVLQERERWVAEVYVTDQEMYRVTLTIPVLNQADHVVFLVSGAGKATVLEHVLEGVSLPLTYPAQLVHPWASCPVWLLDEAAGKNLNCA
jgi:6-phosphogluconolactonase